MKGPVKENEKMTKEMNKRQERREKEILQLIMDLANDDILVMAEHISYQLLGTVSHYLSHAILQRFYHSYSLEVTCPTDDRVHPWPETSSLKRLSLISSPKHTAANR